MSFSFLDRANIYVVEGFELSGKSTFIDKIMKEFKHYHATHDLTDETIGRKDSWTIGYGVIDFLSQTASKDDLIAIDRGVFSSYVYEHLYNQGNRDTINKVVDWYSRNEFFKNTVGHVRVSHYNKSTARRIFELSKSREVNPNTLSSTYDKFSSFEEYWDRYQEAESLFDEVYKKIGVSKNNLLRVKPLVGSFIVETPELEAYTVKIKEVH